MTINISDIKAEDLQFKMGTTPAFETVKDDSPQKFTGIGYTGNIIKGHPYWGNVAFDLSNMEVPDPMAILLNHSAEKIAGWSESHEISSEGLRLNGILSKTTQYGKEVAELSKEGFPWQMSVRISPRVIEEVLAGEVAQVNGIQFNGPGYIFRKSKLSETSFTPIGWDSGTSATALSLTHNQKEDEMSKELEDQITKLEGDLVASKTETENVKLELEAEKNKNKTLEASQAETIKAVRREKIVALFSLTGEEVTEEAIAPYFSMTDDVFSVVANQAKKLVETRAPEGLFSDTAHSGRAPEPKNPSLVDDATKRAEAFEKSR